MSTVAAPAPVDLRETWRRVRLPIVIAVLLLAAAAALAAVEGAPPSRPLDPRDASPAGARALAQLLRDRGVAVHAVGPAAATGVAAAGTTMVVADPASLTTDRLAGLATSPADLVVVAPAERELTALQLPAHPTGQVQDRTTGPGCAVHAAVVAGRVHLTGPVYEPSAPARVRSCYRVDGGAALLTTTRANGRRTTVLGSAATLQNDHLDTEGDAALALGLLGTHPTVDWVIPQSPTSAAAGGHRRGVVSLLPSRLLWAVLQLFVVVVLVALWRGRRLGRVVVEPLPVVVRSAETVEGRARLLRVAGARGRAAEALRAAALSRLTDRLGLPPGASGPAVVDAVARRTGRPGPAVADLLYGAEPPDDQALVRLADDLDALEREVRRR